MTKVAIANRLPGGGMLWLPEARPMGGVGRHSGHHFSFLQRSHPDRVDQAGEALVDTRYTLLVAIQVYRP